MPAFNFFNQFYEDLHKGVHNFTSDGTCTIKCALSSAANPPVATNSILADLVEIAYTHLSSRVITGVTCEQVGGILTVTADDLALAASGGSVAAFQYVSFYNDDPTSPADPLIGWGDLGAPVFLINGQQYNLNFPYELWTMP